MAQFDQWAGFSGKNWKKQWKFCRWIRRMQTVI